MKLDQDLQYVKGIGPKLSSKLKKRSICTVRDFIHWFPRSYQDNRSVKSIKDITPNRFVTFIGYILKKNSIPLRSRHSKLYEIVVGDKDDLVVCKFFRMPYRGWFNSFNEGDVIQVKGTASFYRNRLEFHHPQIFHASSKTELTEENSIIPLYTETEALSQNKLRKIMETIFKELDSTLDSTTEELEWIPDWLKEKYKLKNYFTALKEIHFPNKDKADDYLDFKTSAQKRLIFNEFFELQLYLALKKRGWQTKQSHPISSTPSFLESVEKHLSFSLTTSQKKVLQEIIKNINSTNSMHRLIQGDVGCGKTIVGFITALACAKNKFQTAFMVPTEILAEQHFQNALKFFNLFNLKVEKLTGHMKSKEKKQVLEKLKSGECDICIGTHALIQKDVEFNNLNLVIIDEQHRFGAHQRSLLKSKGNEPHFLVMTATPIPRTLSLVCYGDLDVSVINEIPKGRKPIITRCVSSKDRFKVFEFLKDQVEKGRQAYVVYPLIQESELLDLKNATEQFEKLKKYYKNIKWGLLTGKMSLEEKKSIMNQFKKNEIQVLVSTTVIEVGVDIPNANLIIIENAERFGLSQMHQLRGRIGRGEHKSYCVIVLGENASQMSWERASILRKVSDGFQISEEDLKTRGPGEFVGVRQSGLPHFKVAHLVRDKDILFLAQKAVQDFIQKDPQLNKACHIFTKNKFKMFSEMVYPG